MYDQIAISGCGLLLAAAAASDTAARRISNRLTVPLAIGGLGVQIGIVGVVNASAALAVAGALGAVLLIPWSRGWLGGGDLKLAAGAAVWVGGDRIATYLLASAVVAGGLSVMAYAASNGASRSQIRSNLGGALRGKRVSVAARASGGRVSVPVGAAFAAGALFAVLGG